MAKKNKKPLLNEGTVRRMMKLAEIDTLSDRFVQGAYDYEEKLTEEAEEMDVSAEVDEFEDEAPMPDEEGLGAEDEVSITDEDAERVVSAFDAVDPIIDKLRDAVGDDEEAPEGLEEPGEEEIDSTEMDVELEAPGTRSGGIYEDENIGLYEAALSGLNIEVVDEQRDQKIKAIKEEIYKRVVSRLLKETKSTK
jgi:hypothetical protein